MARAAVIACRTGQLDRLDLADVQGLVVRGYGRLRHAAFLLCAVEDAAAVRALLGRWAADVATGATRDADAALNIAFTAPGLVATGLPAEVVDGGFAAPFAEGMTTEHRSRLLGDAGSGDPRLWYWGGPDNVAVHVLLLVYAATPELLDTRVAALVTGAAGVLRLVTRLPTDVLGATEAFGFVDGLSQPRLSGVPGTSTRGRVVPTGEFVLGYPNCYGQLTERPLLDPDTDPDGVLPRDPEGSGAADLGRNGSYLVFRQLRQDTEAFWTFLRERTRTPDGAEDRPAQWRLAAKMVGRWRSSAPLVLAPDRDDPDLAKNDFGYHGADPDGLACPLGAHIRRTNPRDSLEPRPGSERSLAATDRHRLLRRGRSYTLDGQDPAGDAERGLHFLCLGANIARQYEFVQHTWINSPTFNGLHDDADPLVAPHGAGGATFVEQARPVRRRHRELPDFVHVRGGAYFFLPGVSALHYLAQVPA